MKKKTVKKAVVTKGLKVQTRVKAGGLALNHNATLVRDTPRKCARV